MISLAQLNSVFQDLWSTFFSSFSWRHFSRRLEEFLWFERSERAFKMYGTFGGFAGYFKAKKSYIDNTTFRLHYRTTFAILVYNFVISFSWTHNRMNNWQCWKKQFDTLFSRSFQSRVEPTTHVISQRGILLDIRILCY